MGAWESWDMEREARRFSPAGTVSLRSPSISRTATPSRAVAVRPATATRRAVILAGGPGSASFSLAQCYPPIMFTMFDGRPLVAHMVDHLRHAGVESVIVALSKGTPSLDRATRTILELADDDFAIGVRADNGYKGTAGALRGLERTPEQNGLLVIGGPMWLDGLNLAAMWADHERSGSAATVAVEDRIGLGELEHCVIDDQGLISGVSVRHECCGNEKQVLRPSGVYVLGNEVFDYLDDDGYADIKEQLIPWLRKQDYCVHPFYLEGTVQRVQTLEDYLEINRRALRDAFDAARSGDRNGAGSRLIRPCASIAPDAKIIGPVSIGAGSVIGPGATVIGPSVIAAGTYVGAGATIRESIVWPDCEIGAGATVEGAVVTHSVTVPARNTIARGVMVCGKTCREPLARINSTGLRPDALVVTRDGRISTRVRHRVGKTVFAAGKEAMDRVGAALGLLVTLPLFAAIAIAIKLSSPGPVFFTQRRCGRSGREFGMVKFRTMIPNADKLEKELFANKTGDGPAFKMKNDPRVTKIGKFLRRTCLDELPQLINVLRGEMSLVGPRPMVMSEMMAAPKWRDYRLKVKPGMTGLWQVRGRDSYAFEDRVRDDIDYVRHRSLFMDLRILVQTVRVVLFNRVY